MHGRLKVKTTAQQDAEKKAERLERIRHYRTTMKAIFDIRAKDIEEEYGLQLKMTAGLLIANPDITTLWNIRREVLEKMFRNPQSDKDTLLKKEIDLTQSCLMSNPKSYGSWHHRCWALMKMDNPDWNREIAICNKYLSLDERNFHCWDYRRFVVAEAKIVPEDELQYSMECINENFSNYSAWHYRSKLLPLVHPAGDNGIDEAKRREELELVQNAAFTDPEDSSAWLYHKWLLGKSSSNLLKPRVLLNKGEIVLIFPKPASDIKLTFDNDDDEESVEVKWVSEPEHQRYIWRAELDIPKGSKVLKFNAKGKNLPFHCDLETSECKFPDEVKYSDVTVELLNQELDNCKELFELEPQSKWTLYTMVVIMRTIDSEKYHKDIMEALEELVTLDPFRKGYYQDLRSKFIVEQKILKNDFVLSNLNLTAFYYKQYLFTVKEIDLSHNDLRSLNFVAFLNSCKHLSLDDNPNLDVSTLEIVPQSLKSISLKSIPIDQDSQRDLKQKFPNVEFSF